LTPIKSTAATGVVTVNSSGVLAKVETGAAGTVFVGTSTSPKFLTGGTTGQIFRATTSSDPSWTTATYPATIATGDVVIGTGTNQVGVVATAGGTSTYVLTANGSGSVPTWQAPGGGGGPIIINPRTANYVLQLTDAGKLVTMTVTTTANTVTVPLYSSVAFPVGTVIWISSLGTGITQVIPVGGGVTIKSVGSASHLFAQYSLCCLVNLATDIWLLAGDII
jgi:hypothetical protein